MKIMLKLMRLQGLGLLCSFVAGVHLGINLISNNHAKDIKWDENKIEPVLNYQTKVDNVSPKKIINNQKEIQPDLESTANAILPHIHEINPIHANVIKNYYALAVQEQQRYGFPASVKLAQMLLEGGYNINNPKGSQLVVQANNPFGIKYFGEGVPNRVQKWNELVHPGEWVSMMDDCRSQKCKFVKFRGMWHAFRYHSEFMVGVDNNPSHYSKYITTGTWQDWLNALEKGGYATSKTYKQDLTKIIERYALYQFDEFGYQA